MSNKTYTTLQKILGIAHNFASEKDQEKVIVLEVTRIVESEKALRDRVTRLEDPKSDLVSFLTSTEALQLVADKSMWCGRAESAEAQLQEANSRIEKLKKTAEDLTHRAIEAEDAARYSRERFVKLQDALRGGLGSFRRVMTSCATMLDHDGRYARVPSLSVPRGASRSHLR